MVPSVFLATIFTVTRSLTQDMSPSFFGLWIVSKIRSLPMRLDIRYIYANFNICNFFIHCLYFSPFPFVMDLNKLELTGLKSFLTRLNFRTLQGLSSRLLAFLTLLCNISKVHFLNNSELRKLLGPMLLRNVPSLIFLAMILSANFFWNSMMASSSVAVLAWHHFTSPANSSPSVTLRLASAASSSTTCSCRVSQA